MASPNHLAEIAELLAKRHFDAAVFDCLMFGALAALARARVPVALLVHSTRAHSWRRRVPWRRCCGGPSIRCAKQRG